MELIRAYRMALDAARAQYAETLADGACESYEDYRFKVGIRRGLLHAMQIFEDVVKKNVEEADEF
jgi:hypothetical protein